MYVCGRLYARVCECIVNIGDMVSVYARATTMDPAMASSGTTIQAVAESDVDPLQLSSLLQEQTT